MENTFNHGINISYIFMFLVTTKIFLAVSYKRSSLNKYIFFTPILTRRTLLFSLQHEPLLVFSKLQVNFLNNILSKYSDEEHLD